MPAKRKLSQTHPHLYNAEFVAITKYNKTTPEIKNFKPEDAAGQKLQSWKQKHSHKSMQPTNVSTGSHNYVLWKCPKHPASHMYLARVYNRTNQKKPTGCPHCSKFLKSSSKLWHTHKDLFKNEFVAITKYSKSTPEIKNFKLEDAAGQKLQSWKQTHSHNSMQPTDVGTSSGHYALWKCSKHPETHLYLAPVKSRTRQKSPRKCPRCATRLKEKVTYFSNVLLGLARMNENPRIHSTP